MVSGGIGVVLLVCESDGVWKNSESGLCVWLVFVMIRIGLFVLKWWIV